MRTLQNIRRFRLSDTFIEPYKTQEVPWGPLGYVTFKRTYARRLSEFDPEATGKAKADAKPSLGATEDAPSCSQKASSCCPSTAKKSSLGAMEKSKSSDCGGCPFSSKKN